MVNYDQYPRLRASVKLEQEPDYMLELLGPERFTEVLNIPTWIEGNRIPEVGRLDIPATAERFGVPLRFERLYGIRGEVRGLIDNQMLEVLIDPVSSEQEETFGHEIGHILLDSIGINHPLFTDEDRRLIHALKITTETGRKSQHRNRNEAVCDIIGVHYALPIADLQAIGSVDEQTVIGLMDEYGTQVNETLYQLVRANKLPKRFKVESLKSFDEDRGNPGHVDYICYDCQVRYGSCNGPPESELTLDFNDYYFGGMFDMCKSLVGENG